MKIIGIIQEYSGESKFSRPYKKYKKGVPEKSKDIILDYLLKGGIAIAINMQAIKSLERNDNTILGGIVYFTDEYGFGLIT